MAPLSPRLARPRLPRRPRQLGATAAPREQPIATIEYLNPATLHRNPAFSQAVAIEGPVRTLIVGGQNAVDAAGEIVGPGDVAAQAAQVARNLEAALAAGGATFDHVVQWTAALVEGQPVHEVFAVFQPILAGLSHPAPAINVLTVAGLANPAFLLEVSALAVVPLDD